MGLQPILVVRLSKRAHLVGEVGFEPTIIPAPEAGAIPLGDPPISIY